MRFRLRFVLYLHAASLRLLRFAMRYTTGEILSLFYTSMIPCLPGRIMSLRLHARAAAWALRDSPWYPNCTMGPGNHVPQASSSIIVQCPVRNQIHILIHVLAWRLYIIQGAIESCQYHYPGTSGSTSKWRACRRTRYARRTPEDE